MKLAAAGYKVWIDTMELLGGESFIRDIDTAIGDRAHQVLAILSPASLIKPNPTGERTKAIAVGKKLGREDFLLPLSLGGFDNADLNFQISDINFIQFSQSWHAGLSQLLKKLEQTGTPRDQTLGRDLVRQVLDGREATAKRQERLWTNLLPVKHLPTRIRLFELRGTADLTPPKGVVWAHKVVDAQRVWAFSKPPHIDNTFANQVLSVEWRKPFTPGQYPAERHRIAVELMNSAFNQVLEARGLQFDGTHRQYYFPPNLLVDNKIKFEGISGAT